jgi:hypothetical protein
MGKLLLFLYHVYVSLNMESVINIQREGITGGVQPHLGTKFHHDTFCLLLVNQLAERSSVMSGILQ